MIFMHKESGELYELLVVSLEETDLVYADDGSRVYGIGNFTLYGSGAPRALTSGEFTEYFECLGWL